MSIIFGIYRTDGQDIEEQALLDLGRATERYAADGTFVRGAENFGMGFQPYHTSHVHNLSLAVLVEPDYRLPCLGRSVVGRRSEEAFVIFGAELSRHLLNIVEAVKAATH